MHCKQYFKKIAAALLALTFVCSACFSAPAAAASVDDYEQQKEELQSQINKKQKELDSFKEEKKNTDDYLTVLTASMDLLRERIRVLQAQIDTLSANIQEKETSIANLEVQIEEKQKQFDVKMAEYEERLRILYMSGSISNLEILLSSSDFASLLTRAELVSAVSKKDQAALDTLTTAMEEIKKDQAALEADRQTLLASKEQQDASMAELQSQKDALNGDIAKSKAAANALQNSIKNAQHEIIENEEKEKELNDKINKILYPPQADGSIPDTPILTPGDGITTNNMTHPCPDRNYVSAYWPYYSNGTYHGAVDFACGKSTPPIYAADGGIVISAGWDRYGLGNCIIIYHANGLFTVYGHASALYVREGQRVTKGQMIARVGSTGNSSGNHLHFEVRYKQYSCRTTYDPADYLPYL